MSPPADMPAQPSSDSSVRLAYGRDGLDVALPSDRTTVVVPTHEPAAADVQAELRRALREPIAGPAAARGRAGRADRGRGHLRRHPAAAA